MDFQKLISRFIQFGGTQLVVEYAKLGVLGVVVKVFFMCLVRRQSFKAIYPDVLRKIEPYLIKRYSPQNLRIREFTQRAQIALMTRIMLFGFVGYKE